MPVVTLCLQKHYEDKSKRPKGYKPAKDSAVKTSVDVLTCPRPATPPPPPKKAAPPKRVTPPPVVIRKKKTPPPAEEFEGPKDFEGDNSKWSWMR